MKKNSIQFKIWRTFGFVLLGLAMLTSISVVAQDVTTGLKLHYTFETANGTTVPDVTGNGYDAILVNNATVGVYNGIKALILDQAASSKPFLDMQANTGKLIATLNDFTISQYLWLPTGYDFSQNFVWNFSNSENLGSTATGCMFFNCQDSRYAISPTNWQGEIQVKTGSSTKTNAWQHIAYTQSGTVGTLYLDGVKVATATVSLTPSSLGETPYNWLGRCSYDGGPSSANYTMYNLNPSKMADFRIYDRALSSNDVFSLAMSNNPAELQTQWETLDLGDISSVSSNMALPSTLGAAVTVKWTSSNPSMIDSLGNLLSRPKKFNTPVKLTATLSQTVNDATSTLTKQFTVTVAALNPVLTTEVVAKWDFSPENIFIDGDTVRVKDASESGFIGKLMDVARIRTIGNTKQYNVLDLGNNKGYFDMGVEVGEAVYSLNDFTVSGYYRMDSDYVYNQSWGNNLFSFSNTKNVITDPKGTMYVCLGNQNYEITKDAWNKSGELGILPYLHPDKGTWHHYAYTQNGSVGTIYIDGALSQTATVNAHPYEILRRDGLTGTPYNFIGYPPYQGTDAYLRKTLVYDLQVFNVALTADDVKNYLGVNDTIAALNNAFAENSEYVPTELTNEMNNLSIGDTTAVIADLTLPTIGVNDPSISIVWNSNHKDIISNAGVVNQPNYHSYIVKLTAILIKAGKSISRTFSVNVLPKSGTEFVNNILVKFDFANVTNDTIVTDAAEKHLTGVVKNGAKIRTIGDNSTGKFNVLALGDSIGYFDMGTEVGKLVYGLKDYTIGAYYRIDPTYTELGSNGNFLWSLSNAENIRTDATGSVYAGLRSQSVEISATDYNAKQSVTLNALPLQGNWHHFAYSQTDTIGTIYVDGMAMATAVITKQPVNTLVRDQKLGTLYNWIGRSCYSGDVYLRKTLVTDFTLYKTGLSESQMLDLNISDRLNELENAFAVNEGTGFNSIENSKYTVTVKNSQLSIHGLIGNEKVHVYDIAGHQLKLNSSSTISLKTGIYIVRIDNYVSKVVVM